MDNITEREQPKPERAISFGQDFHPFDPEYTNQIRRFDAKFKDVKQNGSSILLKVNDPAMPIPLNLEIHFATAASFTSKFKSITPFNPTIGYQIDSDDFSLDGRLNKVQKLDKDKRNNSFTHDDDPSIDFSKAPVSLVVTVNHRALKEENSPFSQNMLQLLNRLRINVSFPDGKTYEARPWKISLNIGEINFPFFYPSDTGPLPTGEDSDVKYEGFFLFLPDELEKLSQISAKFVLAEEQL